MCSCKKRAYIGATIGGTRLVACEKCGKVYAGAEGRGVTMGEKIPTEIEEELKKLSIFKKALKERL